MDGLVAQVPLECQALPAAPLPFVRPPSRRAARAHKAHLDHRVLLEDPERVVLVSVSRWRISRVFKQNNSKFQRDLRDAPAAKAHPASRDQRDHPADPESSAPRDPQASPATPPRLRHLFRERPARQESLDHRDQLARQVIGLIKIKQ
jgi:hypothetical protein